MTEQFALKQVLGNGVAVNWNERSVLARTTLVNGESGNFLPRPAFAQQKHRRGRSRDLANKGKDALHLRARSQHVFENSRVLAFLRLSIFPLQQ